MLQRLIARADVFLTNNPRLDSLARAGLDPDTLRAKQPRLIYGAISGYGHTGPKANRSGYDIIAQGEAGLMALTGPPEGGPSRFPSPMADISGGIYTCLGVLAALYARDARTTGTARANSSTLRSWTLRRAGSRTSARAFSRQASARRGSATRIRTSRRISRSGRATRP